MRWVTLAFLFFGLIINWADKSIIGYAVVPIMKEFNLSYSQWGFIGSCFFWFFAFAAIVGGFVSDKVGTKHVLTAMMGAWSVLQFGAFFIAGLPFLVLYRILLGVFEGPFSPTGFSHLNKWFPPASRAKANSVFIAGGAIGGVFLAPALVYLIVNYGWRAAFATLGILSVLWLILWIPIGKERPKASVEPDAAPAKLEKFKWKEFYPILLSPTYLTTLLSLFAAFWLIIWITLWMPVYLVKVINLTQMQMSYAAVIIGVTNVILSILVSSFSDHRFKKSQSFQKARVYVGAGALALAAILFFGTTLTHSVVWTVVFIALAYGLSNSLFSLGMPLLIRLRPERAGLMSSTGVFFYNMAGIIAPLVIGNLVQSAGSDVSTGFGYSILCTSVILLVAGLLFAAFAKPDSQVIRPAQTPELAVSES